MTALAAPGPPAGARHRRRVPWRKLAWVTWRQHRAALAALATLIAGFSAVMIINGLRAHALATSLGLSRCGAPASARCALEYGVFLNSENLWGADFPVFMQLIPLAIGMFVGAPLLAQEYEHRTFRFAWTQGTGRTRWLISKLSLIGVTVAGLTAALGALFHWWYGPFGGQAGLWGRYEFDLQPVALTGWALLALSLGVVLGAALRRTVPAIAATAAAYGILAVLTAWKLRPHYLPPVVRAFPPMASGPYISPTSLSVGQGWMGPGGRALSNSAVRTALERMRAQGTNADAAGWLARHHYVQFWSYQPPSRFWLFQFIEGGWLLALCLLLIPATVWLVRHRAA